MVCRVWRTRSTTYANECWTSYTPVMIYCRKHPKLRPQEVESNPINHGGRLNTRTNNSFGIPIEKYE